jgi:hypothetical protein
MHDRYAAKMRALREAIVHGNGALSSATREALATGGEPPEGLEVYAAKVTKYAYRVTDAEVEALRAKGFTDDQLFEATISLALGAALTRLEAGLGALNVAEVGEGEKEA